MIYLMRKNVLKPLHKESLSRPLPSCLPSG